jgi:hypothetical protein
MSITPEIPSYKVFDIVNSFHAIVERCGDGEISIEDARRSLSELRTQALALGVELPEIDAALTSSVDGITNVHLQFQDITDRLSEGSIDEAKALTAVMALQESAKKQNIPLIGGPELVINIAARIKKERQAIQTEWEEYSDESSDEESYVD